MKQLRSLTSILIPFIFAVAAQDTQQAINTGFDFIVVGTGPAGLVVADRLSEAGKNVLVIEAGAPSVWASGGREAPEWIKNSGQELTRFDVPGFFGSFGAHPNGHRCDDISAMAACVLGGGSAVNSGIWIMPRHKDWEATFPKVQKADMDRAARKVNERIPGLVSSSQDGKWWFPEAFDVVSKLAKAAGWKEIDIQKQPNDKHRTFGKTPFFNIKGERGGPLGSYLLTTLPRKNVHIEYNTKVQRVLRQRGRITGLEVTNSDGASHVIPIAPNNKVVLSAGAFGTAKILFQSGIGPKDQLEHLRYVQPEKMIDEKEWIELPVGKNLEDHAATYIVLKHPDAGTPYNYSGAYTNPDRESAELYLKKRAGPLASSNARISLWDEIKGADGVVRTVQWNGRSGMVGPFTGPNHILLTAYLTTSTSPGRLGFEPSSTNLTVLESPYLRSPHDLAAVAISFKNLLSHVHKVEDLELLQPRPEDDHTEYIKNFQGQRGSNHWMGSTAIGEVLNDNFGVKGMKGLYVADAGVLRGVAGNPVAAVTVLGERAAEVLLRGEV